ncbi:hypothetical protein CEXT_81011, partial [Caerostris extrusa]
MYLRHYSSPQIRVKHEDPVHRKTPETGPFHRLSSRTETNNTNHKRKEAFLAFPHITWNICWPSGSGKHRKKNC